MGVHGVIGFVGAGQMRHDHAQGAGHGCFAQAGPVGGFHPEAVHAAIELNAIGVGAQAGLMALHLFHRIQHGHQLCLADHLGIAGHMA